VAGERRASDQHNAGAGTGHVGSSRKLFFDQPAGGWFLPAAHGKTVLHDKTTAGAQGATGSRGERRMDGAPRRKAA